MSNGQAGKGSKRRPRDDRYCTVKQWVERWAAVEGFRKRREARNHPSPYREMK